MVNNYPSVVGTGDAEKKIIFLLDIEFWDNASTQHFSPTKLIILGKMTLKYHRDTQNVNLNSLIT